MDSLATRRITSAERLHGGVVISFDDGMCALFSASLLHATLSQAEDLSKLPNPDDDD